MQEGIGIPRHPSQRILVGCGTRKGTQYPNAADTRGGGQSTHGPKELQAGPGFILKAE